MLHRLEIENFYSVRDRQVIDLRAAANVHDEAGRLAPAWPGAQERVPKVVALLGPNASGKSNVLKSLAFLSWFVRDSFQSAPDAWMLFTRFQDEEMAGRPMRIAIWVAGPSDPTRLDEPVGSHCRYTYEFVIGGPPDQPQKVLKEVLRYWPTSSGRGLRLFDRDEDGRVTAGNGFVLSGYGRALENVLRPNASVISTLAQLKHPFALLLWRAASAIFYNILIEKSDVDDNVVFKHYIARPDHLDLLNRDISRFDLGIKNIQVVEGPNGPIAKFLHDGLNQPLIPLIESHGTREFVKIFPLIVQALQNGGVAVIDELDLAIHPLVLPEIIRWFHDPERNPRNAQLWFSGHSASLLEDLTKEEVLFCEKDGRGCTTVYGLKDVQGVRRIDNHYRKYMGGVYGAVPRIG
jgi:hypothetical protein